MLPRRGLKLLLLLGLIGLGSGRAHAQVGRSLGVIDPNVAQGRELLSVPGLPPELVKAILEMRPFMSMAEFDAFLARNLDRDQRAGLYQRIFLPINLNATTDDELRLVPGVGSRMLLEFRENRPFESLATFSQEVSKYLAPQDVARLSQYVFVPLDVNTASDDDLRTIPGMTPALLSTIRKHRPYRNLAGFLKAIRASVSSREAARIATFVKVSVTP
jgi:DNA uptake protein ComE-like DNA-binding protein